MKDDNNMALDFAKQRGELATRDGFGEALEKIGANKDIVVLDGDLSDSNRSIRFAKRYPERFFPMGISEADMVCTAAGMATCGKIPFVTSFASFLSGRAYDQILVSVAYSNMNVKLVGSHAGIATGEDGPSAQCITDMAVFRAMPNMSVISPADSVEAAKATEYIASRNGPVYLRLTRPKTRIIFDDDYAFKFGRAAKLVDGSDITIIATGILVPEAIEAASMLEKDGISTGVLNMSTIKPIDKDAVKAAKDLIVTCEDHNIIGGLGSAVAEIVAEHRPTRILRIGIDDRFEESGSYRDLYHKYGLDAEGIAAKIKKFYTG